MKRPLPLLSAISVAFLSFTSLSFGQIIHTDVPDQTLTLGQFQSYDLNTDGFDDVTVSVNFSGGTFISLTRPTIGPGVSQVQTLQLGGSLIDKLALSESIEPSSGTYTSGSTSFCNACIQALFPWAAPPTNDVYVGFRMTLSGSGTTHYAWMQCDVPTTASQITVKAFAMESTASAAILAGDAGALPVELITFEGRQDKFSIFLDWVTASEINNEKFEVEASYDGQSFQTIGAVKGNGTATEQQEYSFKVAKPQEGISYYRLKQIDFDGRFEYSKVISVNFRRVTAAIGTFYPNPSKAGWVHLDYFPQHDEEVTISVFDMTGKLVTHQILSIPSGNNHLSCDFSDLNAGIYTVKVGNKTHTAHRKLIIER